MKMTNGVEIQGVIASMVNDQESPRVAIETTKVVIKNAEEIETETVIRTVTDRETEVTEIAVVEIVIEILEMISSKRLIADRFLSVRDHLRAVAKITTGHQ
jgi:hypothetical protein